ncbi:RNA-directed DNA polymerase, eukaryota, reverse transcriptase zinc-binding domain protein [Tanacetum coccineum]
MLRVHHTRLSDLASIHIELSLDGTKKAKDRDKYGENHEEGLIWDERFEEWCINNPNTPTSRYTKDQENLNPRPKDYPFKDWLLTKVGHTNISEPVKKSQLKIWLIDCFQEDIVKDPPERSFDDYEWMFDLEIDQLADEYELGIGKKRHMLDDIWENCRKVQGDSTYWWYDQKSEEEKRRKLRINIEEYDPPMVHVESFEVKRYSFDTGQSFICVTKELIDALPMGRENGSRFRDMIRKEVNSGRRIYRQRFSLQRNGIRGLLDSCPCGRKDNGEKIMKTLKKDQSDGNGSQMLLLILAEPRCSFNKVYQRTSYSPSITTKKKIYTDAKDIWENRDMILEGSEFNKGMTGNLSYTMNLNRTFNQIKEKTFKDTDVSPKRLKIQTAQGKDATKCKPSEELELYRMKNSHHMDEYHEEQTRCKMMYNTTTLLTLMLTISSDSNIIPYDQYVETQNRLYNVMHLLYEMITNVYSVKMHEQGVQRLPQPELGRPKFKHLQTRLFFKCVRTGMLVSGTQLLKNKDRESFKAHEFLWKSYIGQSDSGNDHLGAIMGYGDYVMGEQCDLKSILRGGTWTQSILYILKGSRGTNLYTISIDEMMKSSPICLLSKASKSKSWLWHRRLNHLNFGTINDLARKDLVRGLPRLKFEKDHLCSACQLGKSKKEEIHLSPSWMTIQDSTWVKFLESKDELQEFVNQLLKQITGWEGFNKQSDSSCTDNRTDSSTN